MAIQASDSVPGSQSVHERFIEFAKSDFAFLERDFGFIAGPAGDSWDAISFVKIGLSIEVSWYKGEVDVLFRVLLENDIFRPYISRSYILGEVVRQIDPNALDKCPALPEWALSAEDAHQFLIYYAMLMQKHCLSILQGDFSILEPIAIKRRKLGEQQWSNRR